MLWGAAAMYGHNDGAERDCLCPSDNPDCLHPTCPRIDAVAAKIAQAMAAHIDGDACPDGPNKMSGGAVAD